MLTVIFLTLENRDVHLFNLYNG